MSPYFIPEHWWLCFLTFWSRNDIVGWLREEDTSFINIFFIFFSTIIFQKSQQCLEIFQSYVQNTVGLCLVMVYNPSVDIAAVFLIVVWRASLFHRGCRPVHVMQYRRSSGSRAARFIGLHAVSNYLPLCRRCSVFIDVVWCDTVRPIVHIAIISYYRAGEFTAIDTIRQITSDIWEFCRINVSIVHSLRDVSTCVVRQRMTLKGHLSRLI